MTLKTADRPACQDQWARMSEIARKCMENEYERVAKAIRNGSKANQTSLEKRPAARVVRK